jgi:hypothetical protein
MPRTIIQLVSEVKDRVAHHGSCGCMYRALLDELSAPIRLAFFIAQRFLSGCNYYFKLGAEVVDVCRLKFEDFVSVYDEISCYACVTVTDAVCGIVDPGVVTESEPQLKLILETVVGSKSKGSLVAEVAVGSGVTHMHASVDKLVGLGYIEKRSINPLTTSKHSRIESKAVVLHSKRYAAYYDDGADGVRVIVGSSYLDKIHDLIIDLLDRKMLRSMPSRDVQKHLGMSRWDMQALRNATIGQDKKEREAMRVCFFQRTGNVVYDSGVIGPETMLWYVGRAADFSERDDAGGEGQGFTCPRNVPVHETVAAVLNDPQKGANGLTANDIRTVTGATYKRAAKVFTEFHKTFGYPLEKVQEGRQLRHKLLPKHPPSRPAPVATAVVKAPEAAAVPTEEASKEAPTSSALPLYSDQQRLNCEAIEDFLRQVCVTSYLPKWLH